MFDLQQLGEKQQHPYRYMRYGQLQRLNTYSSFGVDFLRYEFAWLFNEDDALKVMAAGVERWTWGDKAPLSVCKLSDQKKRSTSWTPQRLLSDWGFEETANPTFGEAAAVVGDKLPSPRCWAHYAKVEPAENYKESFPLHLLTREQASPLRQGDSFIIEALLTPDGYGHEIKIGLRKVNDRKQSDWHHQNWREAGWNLTALVPDEIYSVFAH